jgi:hypothetical protein
MQRPGMESWTCMVERPTMRTGSSQDAPTQEAALPKKGITPMRPRMTRFLRISDTLVLVAATGLGLAGCQVWLSAEHLVWSDLWPRDSHSVLASLWIAALQSLIVLPVLLLCWTSSVLLLRLLTPHPPRRHLWCQPGFLACVAVVFVFAWRVVGFVALFAAEIATAGLANLSHSSFRDVLSGLILRLFAPEGNAQGHVGGAVLLVWLVSWAGGRCRSEPSWVDRAGRVLGAAWVCISLLGFFGWIIY